MRCWGIGVLEDWGIGVLGENFFLSFFILTLNSVPLCGTSATNSPNSELKLLPFAPLTLT
ncbi:MAG: hypothetical protein D6822_02390 [Cyanobacteria bacterium J149]|nr:MAG: hypothetical protein D6822_02390 [Cyanobacteria bacterium J149]